jgi:hypothetical protein
MSEKDSSSIINLSNLKSSLSLKDLKSSIINYSPEYGEMIDNIQETLPSIRSISSNFFKSHSQYMNVTVDVTELTPLSRVKHILARIEQKKSAIAENQIKRKKSEIELRKKQKELESIENEFDRELLEVEIIEIANGLLEGENYVKGAIREMSSLTTQYKSILARLGKDYLTEEDFELDERRYHVMTAMKQALNAARPRGGIIDEGNSIYLFDIGINVATAQRELIKYINMENDLLEKGVNPTHEMTLAWLEAMADLFQDYGLKSIEYKGFIPYDKKSLAQPEHIPLLKSSKNDDLSE